MRIVFISSCELSDRYLIGEVHLAFADLHVVQITYGSTGGEKSSPGALLRRVQDSIWRRWMHIRSRLLSLYLKRRLGIQKWELPPTNIHRVEARELNQESAVSLLKTLSPDAIVVSNAPVLKPSIYEAARLTAINVHFGIVPDYRGNDTIFWPLYLRDYNKVGVSVHRLTDILDGGELVARLYPALSSRDHFMSVVCKGLVVTAPVLVDYLKSVESGNACKGRAQEAGGAVFKTKQRSLWVDLKYAFDFSIRRLRPPRREERLERYY